MTAFREDRRPLAVQLRDRLRQALLEGEYQPGDRLPSEEQMSAQFGVSRATVREALRALEEERLIICRHGTGRFVAPDPASVYSDEITNVRSTADMFRGFGISPRTHVLSLREEPGSEPALSQLNLAPGSTLGVFERVWLAKQDPLIYSIDVFSRALIPGELSPELLGPSLVAALESNYGIHLAYSKAVISAVNMDSALRERIGVALDVPWLLMEQVSYDAGDRPILYSHDYHRGDRIHFRVLRRRR